MFHRKLEYSEFMFHRNHYLWNRTEKNTDWMTPDATMWTPNFKQIGGCFSAVSTPILALEGSLGSSRRDPLNE